MLGDPTLGAPRGREQRASVGRARRYVPHMERIGSRPVPLPRSSSYRCANRSSSLGSAVFRFGVVTLRPMGPSFLFVADTQIDAETASVYLWWRAYRR